MNGDFTFDRLGPKNFLFSHLIGKSAKNFRLVQVKGVPVY